MFRALQRDFGVEPDLDIEAQRAIVTLRRPMSIDWQRVAKTIGQANYTFGGAHLRARGTFRATSQGDGQLFFEFDGTGQRLVVVNPDGVQEAGNERMEVVARVEDWQSDAPRLVVLSAARRP